MDYALYYACGALLLSIKKEPSGRTASRALIYKYLIDEGILKKEDNKLLHTVFSLSKQIDYDDFIEVSKAEAEAYINPAKDLIDRIANILKANL